MQPNKKLVADPYRFDPLILREYDIRGQVGKNLSDQDAYMLGLAFGAFVHSKGGKHVCVGYDGRDTSPALSTALIDGLCKAGMNVENIGLGPTPMLYFAVKDRGADAGIMVTGSHNPPDYNGFKMTLQKEPIFGETIQHIGEIAAKGRFIEGDGDSERIDVRADYIARLMKDYEGTRPLKIAWDAGNGAAGEVLNMLCEVLPGEHTLLFDDVDGSFPNHHPDPTVDKNLIDLQKAVAENGCDLGIAFDGDGDRIGVIDEKGNVLRCDILMTIYAKTILEKTPGATIIGDVKCSQVMFDEINKMGGNAVMWKTGHSLVKAKMLETGAPLAGELSGHIFFADHYYGFDDALYCAIRLLNALDSAAGGLSSLTCDLPVLFSTPEIRFEVDEDVKFDLVPQIFEAMKSKADNSLTIDDIDGIRVSNEDGWWLVRPSNTQSVLVARVESNSEAGLERLKSMLHEQVTKIGYNINFNA